MSYNISQASSLIYFLLFAKKNDEFQISQKTNQYFYYKSIF